MNDRINGQPQPHADPLVGLINLNKPTGITSAKALYKIRSINRQKKSGHAGTLDPGASGVLILCLGKATKMVESLMDLPKVYRTTARLDVTSESFDSDRPWQEVVIERVPDREDVLNALATFEGTIQQVPPNISAIKVDGVPAYKRARNDESMKLKPRDVRVYWVYLHRFDWPEVEFEVCCGRGTYIRSIIRDLGEKLGTGGCLTSLVRTQVGPFTEEDGWSIDAIAAADGPADYLIDIDKARAIIAPDQSVIPMRPEPTEGQPETAT